jgi:transcriptional regulator with XRE-family HTH domain
LKCPRPKTYSENPKTLGEHFKKRRPELGLTQKQAAERLTINPSTALNWEPGRRAPSIRSMPAILTFLDYDPSRGP